ncbi:hypothetical protein [Streptomyces sp. NPDC002078]
MGHSTQRYYCASRPPQRHAADRILSLPLYPQITPDQQQRVVDTLADALGS